MPDDLVREAVELAGKRDYEPGIEMNEYEFMRLVMKWADEFNWLWFHSYDGRKYVGTKGFPDLCLVRKDKMIFAELKIGREIPTADQRKWLSLINSFGKKRIFSVVWRPDDWRKIKLELEW